MEKIELEVLKDTKLTLFLKENLTKKFYRNLKSSNAKILVNGNSLELYKNVYVNDKVTIIYENKVSGNWELIKKDIKIVYEDDNYLVCYKEENLLTIPTKAEERSLYQILLGYYDNKDAYVGFLNRLDKETSGLVLVSKNRYSTNLLQPAKEYITRKYYALCKGKIICDMTITANIEKCDDSNKRKVSKNGKFARTHLKVLKYIDDNTLVELTLDTGRTHQIRLHLSYINHPIIGDLLYGDTPYKRMCLESYYLEFVNPYSKEELKFQIDEDFL